MQEKAVGIILSLLFLVSAFSGCLKEDATLEKPLGSFADAYVTEEWQVRGSAPSYDLPLNLSLITNSQVLEEYFGLNDQQRALLEKNGFVVIDYGTVDDLARPYAELVAHNIPLVVTVDTALHLYHLQFNHLLKSIEEREFYPLLLDMSRALASQSASDYRTAHHPLVKEAARRNLAFFSVAQALLEGEGEEVPEEVAELVEAELASIAEHAGYAPSTIFGYQEDYSQYVPRGHYTQSERLERYFRALMWYGRMGFLLKGGQPACPSCPYLVSEENATLATVQASLIAAALPHVEVKGVTARDVWERIYVVTSFFVGVADDLTPQDYLTGLEEVYGSIPSEEEFADERSLTQLKGFLAGLPSPRIYGGTGNVAIDPPFTEEKLSASLAATAGMRFLGQRYVPDAYMFQRLIFPAVGMYVGNGTEKPFTMEMTAGGPARCFPRGLDIMAALGSERAYRILEQAGDTAYAGDNTSYDRQLALLREECANFTLSDWNSNLYWGWLYALLPLLHEYGPAYPSFMHTAAWQDRALRAALASWAQLRHDTILYVKQSYTPRATATPAPSAGYVEPVPECYARLKALTAMTRRGLTEYRLLNQTETQRLQRLETMLDRLLDMAVDEVNGQPPSPSDQQFLRTFADWVDEVSTGIDEEGRKTTVIADVHTDGTTGQCLEEGVGYVELMVVAYALPNGTVTVGAGPVLSYYEFKQPVGQRLTDQEWRNLLASAPPAPPEWIASFAAGE